LYVWANQTEEIFFRGTTNFFYKGHFFVGVSLVFCVVMAPKWWKSIAAILVLSLALSLTRGLFVAVAIALSLSFLSQRRHIYIYMAIVASVIITVFYGHYIVDFLFDPSRISSSETRSRDLSYVIAKFDYNTLLFGEGFGVPLNGRDSVENSYLWVLWRFGILGLSFMFLPLIMCLRYYLSVSKDSDYHKLAAAYFFGLVMLYILTAFNPFINNSIGLMYLFCALFSLRRLSRLNDASSLQVSSYE